MTSWNSNGNAINAEGIFETKVAITAPAGYCWNAGVLGAHIPGEIETENVVDATCAKEGSYDEVTYCTVCKVELSRETKVINKPAHTLVEKAEAKYLKDKATINSKAT